jgi:hypothetical protein
MKMKTHLHIVPNLRKIEAATLPAVNARVIYSKNHCYWPRMLLGITPMSSVSNGLYFLTLPLVSVMRVIYT